MPSLQINRTRDKDQMCIETCKDYDTLHSMNCPYTQDRWKQQGLHLATQFLVPTPREIRESKAA